MAGVIFNHGIRMEYVTVNPFAAIKRRTKESRKERKRKVHGNADKAGKGNE